MIFNPTEEQKLIINTKAKNTVIQAFAGTGKTTVLVEYSKANPNERFIYAAFNRAIKEEAETRFPRNVVCKTVHAIARSWFVSQGFDGNKIKPFIRRKLYHDFLSHKKASYDEIKKSEEVLRQFYISSISVIDDAFVKNCNVLNKSKEKSVAFYNAKVKRLAMLANIIWDNLKSINNNLIGYTHDSYLKLFQVNKVQIEGFSCILFDESQDSNDVITDIVLSQNMNKIFVGDKHQAIYQFRGSKDALSDFEENADEVLHLTETFRFGDNLAKLASNFLKNYKLEQNVMKGRTDLHTNIKDYFDEKEAMDILRDKFPEGITKIYRTNDSLFKDLHTIMNVFKLPFFINGDLSKYKFDTCLDVYYIMKNRRKDVKEFFLTKYTDLEQLREYAKSSKEEELKDIIDFVVEQSQNGIDTEEFVNKIKNQSQINKNNYFNFDRRNIIILTTAHVAKGLEWKNVLMSSDYFKCLDFKYINEKGEKASKSIFDLKKGYRANTLTEEEKSFYESEINLIYVTITRAKENLFVQHEMLNIINN